MSGDEEGRKEGRKEGGALFRCRGQDVVVNQNAVGMATLEISPGSERDTKGGGSGTVCAWSLGAGRGSWRGGKGPGEWSCCRRRRVVVRMLVSWLLGRWWYQRRWVERRRGWLVCLGLVFEGERNSGLGVEMLRCDGYAPGVTTRESSLALPVGKTRGRLRRLDQKAEEGKTRSCLFWLLSPVLRCLT